MILRNVLRNGAEALRDARIPDPILTAEVLLAQALGRTREFLHAHPDHPVDAPSRNAFERMVERRLAREPLQYITGEQEFFGRRFHVDPTVLIPRPETELVVETVLGLNRWPAPRVLDVGTGSGCVAVTLSLEIPNGKVCASDVSFDAVATARRNATGNHARVLLACADLLECWSGPFEFIVANPPYVHPGEMGGLQPEVVRYEPHRALFPAGDPVDLYRELISAAESRIAAGGYLVLEIGYTMGESIPDLLSGWACVEIRSDLQGIPRVISARAL